MSEDSKLLGLSEIIAQTEKRLIAACGMPDILMKGDESLGASLSGWNVAIDWDKAISAFRNYEFELLVIASILKNNWMPVIRLTTPAERKLKYLLRTAKERGYISHRLAKRIRKVRERIQHDKQISYSFTNRY